MSDEPNQVEDDPTRKRPSPVAVVLVVLVLYPLSIGPAAGLITWLRHSTSAGERVNDIATVFYRPLVWIAEKSPVLIGWLEMYVDWFDW